MTDTQGQDGADREERLETLFHAALDLAPTERADWLAEACADDVALRDELLELLEAHGGAPSAFEAPAWGIADRVAVASETSLVGAAVGPYVVEAVLGEGGMGTVYLAEQQEPLQRRVALKVIKAGMDTAEVVARFDAERRALASLNHPSIAAVYDAGTTERGRPYFVMEYVEGRRITDHCDAERLSLAERVRLFVRVCEAVQHAHGQGIVHRDLKPSNVLVSEVDGEPVPKVIDFGVAKATGAQHGRGTVFTRLGQLVGTPEYMSPEQALDAAGGIDARSDVYSLGVLLYRLVSGLLPLDLRDVRGASETAVRAFFSEAEVPLASARFGGLRRSAGRIANQRRTSPKQLRRDLSGPLDWILAKALEHERARRYATVSDLAADLRAYLLGEPLLAQRPSLAAGFARGLRRRRREAAAAAVVVGALGLGALLADQLAPREAVTVDDVRARVASAAPESAPWLAPGRVVIRNDVGEPLVAGEVVALDVLDASGAVPLLAARRHARADDVAVAVVAGALGAAGLDAEGPVLASDWGVAVLHGVATTRVAEAVRVGDLLALDAGARLRAVRPGDAAPIARALTDAPSGDHVVAFVLGGGVTPAARAAAVPVVTERTRVEMLRERVAAPERAPRGSGAEVVAALAAFERRLARLEVVPHGAEPRPLTAPGPQSFASAVVGNFGHTDASVAAGPALAFGEDAGTSDDGAHASGDEGHDPDGGHGGSSLHGSDPHGVDSADDDTKTDDPFGPSDENGGDGLGVAFDSDLEDGANTAMTVSGRVDDAWVDIDRDGRLDVLLYGEKVPWALMRNDGGRFDDVTEGSNLGVVVDAVEVWWRDLDGDTLPDLVARHADGSIGAWRNLGWWTFTDVGETSQLATLDDISDLEWLDVDGDGALDLRVATAGGGLIVAVNDGAGRFEMLVLRDDAPTGTGSATVNPHGGPPGGDAADDDEPLAPTELVKPPF